MLYFIDIKQHVYYVYILSNINKTLYIGVTNNLSRRHFEHTTEIKINSFTNRYHIYKLVYVESYSDIHIAITREKQLKKWNRTKKIQIIEKHNPHWNDLSKDW
jgi:putative endonuclease